MSDLGGGSFSHISAPAATDRIGASTGPLAGGYSERGEFVWRDASGKYLCNGYLGVGVSAAVQFHAKSTGEIARFETTIARGLGFGFLTFFDPTGRKAFYGYGGSDEAFYLTNEMAAPLILGANGKTLSLTSAGHFQPGTDNGQDCGGASNRFANIRAGTGTIQTSDGRLKSALRPFTEAELRAAKRIAASVGVYQFLDGIRDHVGVIAQDVWAIMVDEGLIDPIVEGGDPSSRYAFLCWDKWPAVAAVPATYDEDGEILVPAQPAREAGDIFSIRANELALFLIAALEARIAVLEAA